MQAIVTRPDGHSLAQRRAAITIAIDKRTTLATLKRDIGRLGRRGGAQLAAELLDRRDPRIARVDVGPFLLWVERIGKDNAGKFLFRERISVWRQCERLTERQRQAVVDFLAAHAAGPRP